MNAAPDLLYSDVENDLRASLRDLLADRCEPSTLPAAVEAGGPDLALWHSVAGELGLAGLLVPEALGGQGASARETALVMEELGRFVAPVPFLGSAVLATSALLASDTSSDAVASLVRRLASGETTGALAVPLSASPGAEFPTSVTVSGDGTLTGTVRTVADAGAADVLVVPASGPEGPALFAVDTTADGVAVTEAVPLDLTRRLADVELSTVVATPLPGDPAAALDHALRAGAGLLASEQLGVAQWCLDETVAYVKQRYQFGRAVGSFQALKHRIADVWLELVGARAAARYAADCLAGGSDDTAVAVGLAQAYCAPVAVHAAEECVQLHGGIGMTWEHPAQLYLKRAKADELALGTPGRHRAALGPAVGLTV